VRSHVGRPAPGTSDRRTEIVRVCTAVASVMLAFPFAILVVTSILFAAGVPLSWFQLPIAAALTLGFAAWLNRRTFANGRTRRFLLAVGATAIAFTACALIEAPIHDGSWDGQAYHALAINQIAAGWNPVREAVPDVPAYADELHYFAKGPWLLAASVHRFTASFEAGKAFGLYFILAAFLFWIAALLSFRGIRGSWALLAAVPIALNPVSGAQVLTFYVDGQLAALIAIVMALLVLIERRHHPALLPTLAIAVALIVSTKLNGALYIVIIAGGYWLWRLITTRAGALARRDTARGVGSLDVRPVVVRPLGVWLLVGVLAGAGVTGYAPYTSQFAVRTLTHGNPFHPHAHWSSIISLESERVYPGAGRIGRLARSLLAPSVIWADTHPGYKLPFTVSRGELKQFVSPDVRFGGFGPLFSGGLLLALATLALLVPVRRRVVPYAGMLVLTGLVVVSVLAFSEGWWPRLAPQLGLAPALIAIVGLLAIRQRLWRRVPQALIVVLCLNSVLVFAAHATLAGQQSFDSQRQLAGLRQAAAGTAIPVPDLDGFPGVRYRLERAGIPYYETDSLPCPENRQEPLLLELHTCRP
jgi:hypothetical protein